MANLHAKKVPPKPLVGRWGNTSTCEQRIDAAPLTQLRRVLTHVISKQIDATADAIRRLDSAALVLDEMGHDDNRVHAAKVGKWARDALTGLNEDLFFVAVTMSLQVKEPLMNILYMLIHKRNYGEPTSLALLVWGKATHQ